MPSRAVTAAAHIHIKATPEEVWAVLTDFSRWPDWNTDIASMRFNDSLTTGTRFTWTSGGLTIHSTLQVVQSPVTITWTGKTFGTNAHHSYTLQQRETGTEVYTEETFTGWLPALLPRLLQRKLCTALTSGLEKLKLAVETKC